MKSRIFFQGSLTFVLQAGLLYGATLGHSWADSPDATALEGLPKNRVLFHAGERKFLNEDIAARTLPQDVWDNVIFGNSGFDLPAYRKGLYGGEAFGNTGLYATYKLIEGKEPWVMMIHIKPECLSSDHLFDGSFYVSAPEGDLRLSTAPFAVWYRANEGRISPEAKSACLRTDRGYSAWYEGIPYDRYKYKPEELAQSDLCTDVIERFIRETQFKVFSDNYNEYSWYIRDRSCIESIDGTPDELYRALAESRIGTVYNLLIDNFLGDLPNPNSGPSGAAYVGLRVLSETSLLDSKHAGLLRSILKGLDEFVSKKDIRREANRVIFSDGYGDAIILAAGYHAAEQAITQGRVPEFQRELQRTLDELVEDFGKVCHGHEGASKAYWDSCQKASKSYGQKLMRLFGH